jgi:hypothetical protein
MKRLLGLTLLGCLCLSACASSPPPRVATPRNQFVAMSCQGPVTIRGQADLDSVSEVCRTIDGGLRIVGTDITSLRGLGRLRPTGYLLVQASEERAAR